MKKVYVNGAAEPRVLTAYSYKEVVKSLENSLVSKVEVDGVRATKSAVTAGRDVKNPSRLMKYHVYFYAEGATSYDWMPISEEEYRSHKADPAFVLSLRTSEIQAPAPQGEPTPKAPKRARKAVREAETV